MPERGATRRRGGARLGMMAQSVPKPRWCARGQAKASRDRDKSRPVTATQAANYGRDDPVAWPPGNEMRALGEEEEEEEPSPRGGSDGAPPSPLGRCWVVGVREVVAGRVRCKGAELAELSLHAPHPRALLWGFGVGGTAALAGGSFGRPEGEIRVPPIVRSSSFQLPWHRWREETPSPPLALELFSLHCWVRTGRERGRRVGTKVEIKTGKKKR